MPASKPSTGPNIIVVIFLAVAVLMFAYRGDLGGQQRARAGPGEDGPGLCR